MKNPTFKQLGGLSGSVADSLREIQDKLDGEKLQLALNNPNHPFLEGVVTLALKQFPVVTWTEKDGVIHVTLTSNGWSGPEWEQHFDRRGVELSPNARKLLNHSSFKVSKAGTIRSGTILKGALFSYAERVTKTIRAKAASLKLRKPDMELVCLIRDVFSNKEINAMGLNWIVGMHEPVEIHGGLSLLTANACGVVPKLRTDYVGPGSFWDREDGFAFAASQVELKA